MHNKPVITINLSGTLISTRAAAASLHGNEKFASICLMSSARQTRAGLLAPLPGRTDQWNTSVWEIYGSSCDDPQHRHRNHLQLSINISPVSEKSALRLCSDGKREK